MSKRGGRSRARRGRESREGGGDNNPQIRALESRRGYNSKNTIHFLLFQSYSFKWTKKKKKKATANVDTRNEGKKGEVHIYQGC